MDILIAAIGKLKGEEQALYQRYASRLRWKVQLIERPERGSKAEEAKALRQAIQPARKLVVLDEHGLDMPSVKLAQWIGQEFDTGSKPIAFVIGGADGLEPALIAQADLRLRFGAQTWPHQLVRALLAEQLYRAQTILDGHPYHKA